MFGVPFDGRLLIERVGLDADTNTNLTRRLLLLLESREVSGDAHEECWKRVLGRYLDYGVKDHRPPRFLLNDLVCYWRTMCRLEGKQAQAEGDDPKWVSRNAKLRTSRKLLFAGGLVPLLLCHLLRADEMRRFLAAWLSATPSDGRCRISAVRRRRRRRPDVRRLRPLARDHERRWSARRAQRPHRRHAPRLRAVARHSHDRPGVPAGVLALLFETPRRSISSEYAVF